jgi:hypothetical protein
MAYCTAALQPALDISYAQNQANDAEELSSLRHYLVLKTDLLDGSLPAFQTDDVARSCNAAENSSSGDQQPRSAGVAREAVAPELPIAAIL